MKTTYKIDTAHSSAQFVVRHMMISNVRGGFGSVTGTVDFDPENPASTVINAVIDATTINTLDEKRDAHLKSPDFLDTAQFPSIEFRSTTIEPAGAGEWNATGNLTVHGVSQSVTLKVEGPTAEGKDPWGNTRVGASATTKIKRSDFGLSWNAALETGGVILSDDIKIELEVQLIKS